MLKKSFQIYGLALLSLLYLVNLHPARAQSFSLSVSPPLYELMIQPGKTVDQVYTLKNEGTESLITPRIVEFQPADNKGNIKIVNIDSGVRRNDDPPSHTGLDPVSIQKTSWFSIANSDVAINKPFLLKEGQTKQITLRISVPKNAIEDDYYLTLLFESNPEYKTGITGSHQVGMIGSNILLTVSESGLPIKKGEIKEFYVYIDSGIRRNDDPPSHTGLDPVSILQKFHLIDSFSKPTFELIVKNTGRTFWKTFGKITITGLMKYKKEMELLPENVLGGGTRELRSTTCGVSQGDSLPQDRKESPYENGKVSQGDSLPQDRKESPYEVIICPLKLNSQFLFGPYKAKATINIDGDTNEQTITDSFIFIALPIKLILGILGCLGIIWGIRKARRFSRITS